jgi:cytochrome c oxidase cbb3-type subunit 3
MSTQDRLLNHNYDGIQEYDNPMPRWWVWIFWACIIFSEVYFIYYHLGPGKGIHDSYQAEMAHWDAQLADLAPVTFTEDELMAIAQDPARQAKGGELFQKHCMACHTADGVVIEGVLAKGMPAWDAQLAPDDLNSVVTYVYNLRGTTPANPKAPEGDLYE